jgi:hypothetical protein
MAERPRRRVAGLAFAVALALYVGGGLLVLGGGLLTVAAAALPGVHDTLHVLALGSDWFARFARRAADASHVVPSTPQIVLDYVFTVVHLGLAAILLWLRPRDWCARLLAVALVGVAVVFNLTSQATFEHLPMTWWESLGQAASHVVAGLAYIYALLLFPDSRPVPRWRPLALLPLYLMAMLAAVGLAVRVEGPARPATLLLFFGLVVPASGAAAQWYRIHHTDDATGQAQARLVFWALLPSVAFGVVFLASNGLPSTTTGMAGRHLPEPPVALYRSFQPAFALIPMALFAGLLRYRLWDIERLLNRTIVYATATGLLGGVYVSFVVVTQQALGSVAATPLIESRGAVAVTTLLLASVFRPVRDRVQRFVDRRFHRSRYDGRLTVERFVRRLRDQVDTDHIAHELEAVLAEVIEPREVSLWLCPGGAGAGPGGTAPTSSTVPPGGTRPADRTTRYDACVASGANGSG